MKNILSKTSIWFWSALLVPVAKAATTVQEIPTSSPKTLKQFLGVIDEVAKWMFNILIALSVVFILYAAFLYLVAQGSDEKIGTAKKVLIYAIVGLVVGVLAGGVSSLVKDWIT